MSVCEYHERGKHSQKPRTQTSQAQWMGMNSADAGDVGSIPDLGRSHVPWNCWAHESQLLSLKPVPELHF